MNDDYAIADVREPRANPRTVLVALHWEDEPYKQGILERARRSGWRLLFLRDYNMELPRSIRPDGVLFHLANGDAALVRKFLRMGVPAVQIQDHYLPKQFCRVVQDRWAIGRTAAKHFGARGFEDVAYLHAEEAWEHSPTRLVGQSFIRHARMLGARAGRLSIPTPDESIPSRRLNVLARRFQEEISRFRLPLGIFTHNDLMARHICHFCEDVGLSVPEQVAVLGMGNDVSRCECCRVPVSSLDPNYLAQGRAGAELLDRLMEGRHAPRRPVLIRPLGVVRRQSTDILALPDLETAKALRYMWTHHAMSPKVSEIAAATGVCRRKLERHFRRHLNRSVTEELNRRRIERGCELLIGTRLTVDKIARQVGFNSPKYFYRVFRTAMGMTPRKYRLAEIARRRKAVRQPAVKV